MVGLRVVIAGCDGKMVREVEDSLKKMGCLVVGKAADSAAASKIVWQTEPDFVLLEAGVAFLEVAKTVEENLLAPVLLVTDRDSRRNLACEIDRWGFDCLEKPVLSETLAAKISRGLEKYALSMEAVQVAQRLSAETSTRNLVTKAKETLMEHNGLSEIRAILRIQILGQRQGISMAEMARKIITGVFPMGASA